MPTQEYIVAAEDAPVRVARELDRPDVSRVRLEDIDGEVLLDVPGSADPEAGARQVLGAFDDYGGGGVTLRLVVQTVDPGEVRPSHVESLEDPPEEPDEGEPGRHGREPIV